MMTRTPSTGIHILERLHVAHPCHQGIINNLIDKYIRFNMNEKAMVLIQKISDNTTNLQNLRFKTWYHHQKDNHKQEYQLWEYIFHKNLNFLPLEDRLYLIKQAQTEEHSISIFKENWHLLFNYAFSAFPVKIQEKLGSSITDVILVANNNAITLEVLENNIDNNTLVVCFNHNVFLPFYKYFPQNSKLLFFRKENHLNHNFLGLIGSMMVTDPDDLFKLMQQDNSYFLFNEHKPHSLDMPEEIYKKIYNPMYSSVISQFHRIFHYLLPPSFYFQRENLTPSSGFMVLRYLYYTRLYLYSIGRQSFNIKLLGFNFKKDSYYPTYGPHNWDYERSQLEDLPSSITRVIV